MSRASSLIVLGTLTILAPFSGLPIPLSTLLIVGFGAAVLGIGVAERSKEQRRQIAAEPPRAEPAAVVPAEPPTPPEVTQGTAPPTISAI